MWIYVCNKYFWVLLFLCMWFLRGCFCNSEEWQFCREAWPCGTKDIDRVELEAQPLPCFCSLHSGDCFYYLLGRCIIKQEFMHLPKAWWRVLRAECMVPHMHTRGFRSLLMASEWGYIQAGSQRGGVRSENQMENSKEGPQGQPEKTGGGSELVFPILTGSCEQLTDSQYLGLATDRPMPAHALERLTRTAPECRYVWHLLHSILHLLQLQEAEWPQLQEQRKSEACQGERRSVQIGWPDGCWSCLEILPWRNTPQWRVLGAWGAMRKV